MYRLLFVISLVHARTVRLTNVPSETARGSKTYEIEVPGRDPIRIIEADPLWDNNRYPHRLDFRRYSTELPPTSTTESNLVENSTKIYSPEALNAFLKSYAERLREKKRQTSAEQLRSTEIDRYSGASVEESDDDYDKSKRWGLVDTKRHSSNEEKDGWVTMDAIPWSSSQISKWQTNKPKPQEHHRPDSYHSNNDYHQPSYSSYELNLRPYSKPTRPNKPIYEYNQTPFSVNPNLDFERPTYQKPSYNIHVSNRPSWNEDKKPYITVAYDNYPVDPERDIITDGRPGDFPSRYVPKRPYEALQERPTSSVHPNAHPVNGHGEWVLLSTTKGYQYPRQKHQRAVAITPNSIGVKRSVRLTVLPPEENSKINMTTSHGGLLEVDATFETVEESQKIMSERLQLNKTKGRPSRPVLKLKRKPQKSQPKSGEVALPVVQDSRMSHQPDTSAVLAAIGAGMVPATMAMLMPFVNGRKKKSPFHVLNATNVPYTQYELTLQKSY